MGKKKAGARKNVRKRDEYAEVIPAKKKRGPPRDRAARRAPEPTDADREAELKRLRTFLKRRDVARSATDDWTVRFDDDGKFDAYVSAAGEAYTTKTAVLRALAPADVDAGPSAAQVWGASRPGAEDQAIAALVDGLVADVEDRLGLYDLPPTLRGDETAVRRLLEAASKRSEPLRSITSTQLARVLLDLAAPGYGAGVLSRLARSKGLGKIVVCGGAAATADALAAAEAAEHAFAAGVEPDPRAAACFDPVDLALAANAHAHAFATCTRTKLEPGAPPTVVARFADRILARCCRLELEARRAAGTLLVALRAAAAREAAAAPPVALPAAAAAVAPLTELPEAYHLLRALADVYAETDAYAYEGAEQAFGPLDAAVEARSLGRLRMAALHLFSKLDAAVFDRKWRALPSSGAVFGTTATAGRTWLSYARPGGAPPRWQWPFFYAADDAELARLLVELARVTRADEEPSPSGRFLEAAVAFAAEDASPRPSRPPPASADELEAARAAIDLDEWLAAHLGGDGLAEARAAVREAAGGDLWRLQTLRPRDLSRKLPLSRWEAAARDAFLEAARDLRAGELGFENACEWLDDVVEAAGGAAVGTTVFLPHGDAGESLRDSIVPGGVVVSLGGGIDVITDLLEKRRLLGADSPVAALIYFDTDGAALSTAKSGYPRDSAVPFEVPDAWKGYARGDVHQLLDPARRAEILGGRPVTFVLNTPSCKAHAAVVVDRDEADTEGLEKFLEAEKRLAEDTAAALLAAGAPAAQQMHALGEFGNTPTHVDAKIKAVLDRSTFRLNAANVSPMSRLRTFCSTFPQRPVADDDQRHLLSPREALDAYLAKHGDRVLLPTYGPDYVLHKGNAGKARTPRALAPPDRGPIKTSVEAALAKAHGGVNFAAPPPAAGRDPEWHELDVKATSVLVRVEIKCRGASPTRRRLDSLVDFRTGPHGLPPRPRHGRARRRERLQGVVAPPRQHDPARRPRARVRAVPRRPRGAARPDVRRLVGPAPPPSRTRVYKPFVSKLTYIESLNHSLTAPRAGRARRRTGATRRRTTSGTPRPCRTGAPAARRRGPPRGRARPRPASGARPGRAPCARA